MRTVQALVRMVFYMALLAAVVLIPHFIAYAIVPCPTEDSTNCYWDANVQGNGTGNSFIDINGTAYYLEVN